MIDLNTLNETHIGQWVQYRDVASGKTERGRIKSWNTEFIFVVYQCDGKWAKFANYISTATHPANLIFITV